MVKDVIVGLEIKFVDCGERGKYWLHNKLNDLTGKEWIKFTKSFKVIPTNDIKEFLENVIEQQITYFTKIKLYPTTF